MSHHVELKVVGVSHKVFHITLIQECSLIGEMSLPWNSHGNSNSGSISDQQNLHYDPLKGRQQRPARVPHSDTREEGGVSTPQLQVTTLVIDFGAF